MRKILFCVFFICFLSGVVQGEMIYSYAGNMAARFAEPEEKKLFVYNLKYQEPPYFADCLKQIDPEVTVISYKNSNSVGIYTTLKKYKQIQPQLELLDHQIAQIRIEVEVVEMNKNRLHELGIKWDTERTPQTAGNLAVLEDTRVFSLIKAATQQGTAKIKANPSLVVKDSSTAIVRIGDKVPVAVPDKEKGTYSVSYIDAGIKLQINPKVVSDNLVSTVIQPEISSIKTWKVTSAGEYPVISTKEAQTAVVVKSNQVFMIAGLTGIDEKTYVYEVPFLSAIPIVGGFFRFNKVEEEETEIIFCIKPTIIRI